MSHGPRDLLWIGCLTGLIWTHKFKSFTLTPNTNSPTCWPKAISHVMGGIIFFVCLTSWISRCFLAAILFQWKIRAPCRREPCKKEKTGEEPVVVKSRPVSLISRRLRTNQSPMLDSGTSYSTGNCRLGWNSELASTEKSGRDSNENSASSSQVWHRDDKPFPSGERSGREVNQRSSTEKLGATSAESTHRGEIESPQSRDLKHPIHWKSLRECSTKVDSSRRRPDGSGAKRHGIDKWIFYVNGNESSDSLGENYKDNLFTCKNTNVDALMTLLDITQKLILNQNHDILNVSKIKWKFTPWMRSTLLHDKVIKLSKAKIHVYSDSVLCLGKMHRHPEAVVKRKEQLQCFQNSNEHKELFGIDGELFEFEWNIFPGHSTVETLEELQIKVVTCGIRPAVLAKKNGTERITANLMDSGNIMQMSWLPISPFRQQRQFAKQDLNNLKNGASFVYVQRHWWAQEWKLQRMSVEFWNGKRPLGHRSFLGPGEEEKWYETQNYEPEGQWNSTADVMVSNSRQRTSSLQSLQCVGSRILEKGKVWKYTIHFSAGPSSAVLLFRTINSANQLSIYGAVADWCHDLTQQILGQSFSNMEKSIAESEWAAKSKLGAWRSAYVGANTWDECSSSEGSTAYPSRKIWKVVRSEKSISDLWISWIHEESLHWTIHPKHSRCGWLFWEERQGLAESTRHLVIIKFWTYWMDLWTHQGRSSSSSQNQMLSWQIWNWNTSTVQHQETDLIPGFWYPDAQTAP